MQPCSGGTSQRFHVVWDSQPLSSIQSSATYYGYPECLDVQAERRDRCGAACSRRSSVPHTSAAANGPRIWCGSSF
jgi:hypothetical protein